MDHILSGRDGYAIYEVDAKDHEIPGTETVHVDPVNGGDIQLTIDVTVQRFAEEALAKSVSEHHAQSGECIVMNPKTGDILAMASMPQFDLNHLAGTNNNQWDNHVVSYSYEPGSTLKSVTLSACLNEFGLNYQYTHVYCSGQIAIGGHIIHCAKDPPLYGVHGDEIMRDVLKNSCNIGAAQFAMHLGDEKLYSYEKAFGFLDRPDIGLPGSPPNRLKSPLVKKWSKIQLANIGFGQGISVTPLQLASAYCVFGNEGRRVYPHIIKGRTAPEQSIQVIKPEVAKTMLSMLQTVVEDGTGKPAQIAGYNIGGKTGSAQVVENGHYGGQYIGSFCGIVPLSDPKLVILCAVNKPSGVHWGSVVAAPVVHDVAQQTLWYMQQPRDNPVKLDAVDQAKVDARAKAQAERAKRNRD
jgi:stage V sporulation protein D (sporulation-specific penicillin-binding protein)